MKTFVAQKPLDANPFAARPCPSWFQDAKIGIFVHWGPYSVPGWAITGFDGIFGAMPRELARQGYDLDSVSQFVGVLVPVMLRAMLKGRFDLFKSAAKATKYNAYAEWYWNSLRSGGPTAKHHKEVWGDRPYEEFGADFNKATESWDASSWAEILADAGAKYVLATAKHHDGFCLWPTEHPCPNIPNWQSKRDLLGDLKSALTEKDMRFALYYSAGFDWTFHSKAVGADIKGKLVNTPQGIEYFNNHLHELIDRYQPDILWQDISYPRNGDYNSILKHYYDVVPHGVVNDRSQGDLSKLTRHFDFTTTEYFIPETIRQTPWEICRGVSGSFGYNQLDDESTSLNADELVASMTDIVSKNGNLMLGLGPQADGTIPEHQVRVVKAFGDWLKINGEAIYGTRPHVIHRSTTNNGHEVRFTTKDGTLYAIVLGQISGKFHIQNLSLRPGAKVRLLEGDVLIETDKSETAIESSTHQSGCCLAINLADHV